MSKTKVIDVRVRNDIEYKEEETREYFTSILMEQYKMREFPFVLFGGSAWTGTPYSQEVNVTGMTPSMSGTFGISLNATQQQYQAAAKAQLRCTGQGNGNITITAYGTKPSIDIPCVIIGAYEPLSDN